MNALCGWVAGPAPPFGARAEAEELVVRDRRRCPRRRAARRRRRRRSTATVTMLRVVAARRELRAARVVEREGLEVDRRLARPSSSPVVEVAQQAGCAARADGRGRAAHQEAQLAPARSDRWSAPPPDGDLGVAALALAPVVALLVALAGVGAGCVLREGDVIVAC